MRTFEPLVKNPHLLTIAGNFWSRPLDARSHPSQEWRVETEPGITVVLRTHEPEGTPRGELLLVHGLEGSAEAGYIRSMTYTALAHGYRVHRFNMRSCGGFDELSCTTYHAGLTSDARHILQQLRGKACWPLYLMGYSLGGNMTLKLAGEEGQAATGLVDGVIAVSAPIDLAACVKKIGEPQNRLYARRFLSRLKERVLRRQQREPGLFAAPGVAESRSIYEFDDRWTAPLFGFGSADRYYATQSSHQYLGSIRTPTLVVQAEDDPMIPFEVYRHPAFRENPALTLVATRHGGHLGFISKRRPRFWLDETAMEWLEGTSAWARASRTATRVSGLDPASNNSIATNPVATTHWRSSS